MAKDIINKEGRGRLVRGDYPRVDKAIRFPKGIHDLIVMAAHLETQTGDVAVSFNEFVFRACIERIGKVKGERVARRLLRQYFNGITFVPEDEAEAALDARHNGRRRVRGSGEPNGSDKDLLSQ